MPSAVIRPRTYAQVRVSAEHYTEQPDLSQAPVVDALGRKVYPKRYCLNSTGCTARDPWLAPADFAALLVNHRPVHGYSLQRSITFKAGVKTDNSYFNVYYSAD